MPKIHRKRRFSGARGEDRDRIWSDEGTVKEQAIRKEKEKARHLRQSAWWMRKTSTGQCHYCGKKVDRENLTMDHVVPLSRGGKSSKGNIVPACKECNNKKKYLLPIEWQEYLGTISDHAEP